MKKKCFKCGEEKNLDEFYKHPMMADGHLGKCKTCNKKDVSENYQVKREQYAKYEKERYQRPERKKYSQENLKKRDPLKTFAKRSLNNAVRDGKITKKPCAVCSSEKSQAHHPDYNLPLEVVWLCRKHHLAIHGKKSYDF